MKALGRKKAKIVNIVFFSVKDYDKIWFTPLCNDYGYTAIYIEAKLDKSTASLAKSADVVCAFVNDELDEEVIKIFSSIGIKGILMRCAGYNNVDLAACKKHNIKVLRVPGYSPEAVAEFGMGLLLSVNRHIHRAYTRTRDFNMNISGLMGRDLHGKVAGIIGTGRIGQAMINICKGFGMQVIAYDVYPNDRLDVKYVPLEYLFENSDIISLHCPLTEETKYIIDENALNKMRKGVYIVNTSRGKLIKTSALLEALLVTGKIGGVGLDVYEEENDLYYEDKSNEIMEDERLARLTTFPNVIITSHQGYFTREAMQSIAIETMENAYALDNGENLVNEVK